MARERGYTDAQFNKLVAEVKKHPGNSERHYSEVSGIEMSKIGKALYDAEVVADPKLKIPATGPSIVKARDAQGIRWPRIAARTGLSVAAVQKLYQETSGKSPSDSWTGRGRRTFDGNGAGPKAGPATKRGGKAGPKAGTSGRRGAATKPAAGPKRGAVAGKRGTRAAANPK